MPDPLVSIVIPCWNAERTIGEAIESALSQTYPKIEVIVIDDGSSDASLDAVTSFGSRVRWETGPNRGGSAARNRGLALATGSLVQFLDADDLLNAHKLEVQADRAGVNERSRLLCDRRVHPADQPAMQTVICVPQAQDGFATALDHIISASGPVYQKRLLDRLGGYREDLPNCQDYELHLRLALYGCTFVRIPEVLLTIRRNRMSVSSDLASIYRQMVRLGTS